MISSFSLGTPSRIIFGVGKLAELEKYIPAFGSRPLLVIGSSSFTASDGFAVLQRIFATLALPVKIIHVATEPSPDLIDSIVADQRYAGIDMVISVGGGSVLDAGKTLAAMLVEGGEVRRFLEGVGRESPSGRKLPFVAVPTTAGTGSEATCNAVLSSVGRQGFKKSLRHNNYFPDIALVDPALTVSCPRKLTIACGMDCFTQLVEGYLSTAASPLTDALALDGIRAVHCGLRRSVTDGSDLAARSSLAYGALLSGIVLANAGLGTVHGFASSVGGLFAIPHGVVCGSLMAPTNRATLRHLRAGGFDHPALGKYAELGKIVSGQTGCSQVWYQDRFIAELEELGVELALPCLGGYGITEGDAGKIAAQTANKNNPAQLTPEELVAIVGSRIG